MEIKFYYHYKIWRIFLCGIMLMIGSMNILHAEILDNQVSKDLKKVYVNLDFQGAPLPEVFEVIKAKTDYSFVYDKKQITDLPPVNLRAENQSLETVLLQLASSHKLSFQQVNERISVKRVTFIAVGLFPQTFLSASK